MRQEDFSLELCFQRSTRNLTQKQLADMLKVSDRSVKLWESGSTLPRKSVRIQMAQVFELPLTHFLLDDEIPKRSTASPIENDQIITLQNLCDSLYAMLSNSNVSEDLKKDLSQAIYKTVRNNQIRISSVFVPISDL